MKKSEATLLLTQILSKSVVDEALRANISASTTDWHQLLKIANRHLLGAALYSALQKKGLLSYLPDCELEAFLKALYDANLMRNQAILLQLQEIANALKSIGIEMVMLKGAAALSEDHYDDLGVRMMSDIDILVPPERIMEAIAHLQSIGYAVTSGEERLANSWHHYHRMHHEKHPAALELHRYMLNQRGGAYTQESSWQNHLQPSATIEYAYVLEPSFELLHAFINTQLSHAYHQYFFISLRHLHHFAVMLSRYELTFTELQEMANEPGVQKIFDEYACLLAKLFSLDSACEEGAQIYAHKAFELLDRPKMISFGALFLFHKVVDAFSYKKLQAQYRMKTKLSYPFYIGCHLLKIAPKYFMRKEGFTGLRSEFNRLVH